MKKLITSTAVLGVACLASFAQEKSGTFSGEIMDKPCALMQSHANMMKEEGAEDAKECTLKCVKDGAPLVLFDPATKKVYSVDNPKKAHEYAGQRVQIAGTYDDDAQVLHIKSIVPGGK